MTVVEYETLVEAPAETEREKRARTLEAAALEMEVRGWCRGMRESGDGRVCLVGAIAAANGGVWRPNAYTEAQAFFPQLDLYIEEWNDDFARKPEEAAFLLRWRAQEIRDGWDA